MGRGMPAKTARTQRPSNSARPKARNLSHHFTVAETPTEAFAAINNVRAWWSGDIEGRTDKLGAVFTYRYQDVHYSKQRITEWVPGKRVVWLVLDSYLNFIEDKTEWNGTKITFKIVPQKGGRTEVQFTHVGLAPADECFGACYSAWGFYIKGSLRKLIAKGQGEPNPKSKRRTGTADR
jgi:hypothetical protein